MSLRGDDPPDQQGRSDPQFPGDPAIGNCIGGREVLGQNCHWSFKLWKLENPVADQLAAGPPVAVVDRQHTQVEHQMDLPKQAKELGALVNSASVCLRADRLQLS
jgi:hypothetical protein